MHLNCINTALKKPWGEGGGECLMYAFTHAATRILELHQPFSKIVCQIVVDVHFSAACLTNSAGLQCEQCLIISFMPHSRFFDFPSVYSIVQFVKEKGNELD